MSILYTDNDGYFVSHELFISELYGTILNKTEKAIHFYEHFFHVHNPFVRDQQRSVEINETDGVKRKRKRLKFEVNF